MPPRHSFSGLRQAPIAEKKTRLPEAKINVTGHNLGAGGLLFALCGVANRGPMTRLGQAELLAPDMDFDAFRKFLPHNWPVVSGITIHATNSDHPLALSAQVRGYARLGKAHKDVTALNGVEVSVLSDLPVRPPLTISIISTTKQGQRRPASTA